ncbi:MAG: MoaD/ThiS family protein [Planctomycetes bacterium]|nr:MoaD/ThiS family protein [Planctomycetota bacterium]
MISIRVRYVAQLKQAAGVAVEEVELSSSSSVRDLLLLLADRHGAPLGNLLLGEDGSPQSTILVFVRDEQIVPSDGSLLKDGDVVTLLSPMAGG